MGAVRKALRAIRASQRLRQVPITRRVAPGPANTARLIERLVAAQGRICPTCDDWLEFDPEFDIAHPLRPSVDHVIPRSRGGGHLGNQLAMHRECNCAKGNRLPTGCERIWLAAVNARLGL